MRHPTRTTGKGLYAEIQATRMPTKYANRRAESALQCVAEPLSTVAWMLGEEYPRFQLDRANFLLLTSHAHDSIGGCGYDNVDEDVRYRLRQAHTIADALTERAVRAIARRIDTAEVDRGDILLIVINTLSRPRTAVVEGEIDFDRRRKVGGFRVQDLGGGNVPVQIIGSRDAVATFCHPTETPSAMESRRWRFYFKADDVPALGYRVFRVIPEQAPTHRRGTMLAGPGTMENEHLRVAVNGDGTADVTCKDLGWTLRGQNAFEDRAEVGDYWMTSSVDRDRVISSLGGAARIAVVEDGPLSASIEAKIRLDLPIRAKRDRSARETETRAVEITTVYRLVKGERFLRIETTIENTVEDHILRALFPTGVDTDVAHVEAPFDVVARPIPPPDDSTWLEPYRAGQPNRRFVDLSDAERGVAVLNRGLPHYAAEDDPDRTVALTLLRCHPAWNSIRQFYYEDQTGTQLLGTHTFAYALMPHRGDWQAARVPYEADRFDVDPLVAASGPGEGVLSADCSFLSVEGDGVMLHAVKQGERDASLIVRLSNPTDSHVDARLTLTLPFDAVESVNTMEDEVKRVLETNGSSIAVPLPPKKIATVRIALKS